MNSALRKSLTKHADRLRARIAKLRAETDGAETELRATEAMLEADRAAESTTGLAAAAALNGPGLTAHIAGSNEYAAAARIAGAPGREFVTPGADQ